MKEITQNEKHEPDREALPILEGKRNIYDIALVRINPTGEDMWGNYWKEKSFLR